MPTIPEIKFRQQSEIFCGIQAELLEMQFHICRSNFSTFNNDPQIFDSPVDQHVVQRSCALAAFNYKKIYHCQYNETFITIKSLHISRRKPQLNFPDK